MAEELIEPDSSRTFEDEPDEEPTETAEAERRPSTTKTETHYARPPLLRLLAWIIGIAVIVVLIVLGARWIYHASHHQAAPAPSTAPKSPLNSSSSKASGNQKAQANSSSSSSQSATSGSASTRSQLTNTGPGDLAVIFAGSSMAAAGLHYLVSLRRFNKTRL